jgi:hypothetical protein
MQGEAFAFRREAKRARRVMWWKVSRGEAGQGGAGRAQRCSYAASVPLHACARVRARTRLAWPPPTRLFHTHPQPRPFHTPTRARARTQNVRMWFLMGGIVAAVVFLIVLVACGWSFKQC